MRSRMVFQVGLGVALICGAISVATAADLTNSEKDMVLIPKGEFLMGNALEKMPQDKKIVLHCKTGVRSAEVLAVLKSAGFADAVHLGGGVIGWVNQIEPEKPVY